MRSFYIHSSCWTQWAMPGACRCSAIMRHLLRTTNGQRSGRTLHDARLPALSSSQGLHYLPISQPASSVAKSESKHCSCKGRTITWWQSWRMSTARPATTQRPRMFFLWSSTRAVFFGHAQEQCLETHKNQTLLCRNRAL